MIQFSKLDIHYESGQSPLASMLNEVSFVIESFELTSFFTISNFIIEKVQFERFNTFFKSGNFCNNLFQYCKYGGLHKDGLVLMSYIFYIKKKRALSEVSDKFGHYTRYEENLQYIIPNHYVYSLKGIMSACYNCASTNYIPS